MRITITNNGSDPHLIDNYFYNRSIVGACCFKSYNVKRIQGGGMSRAVNIFFPVLIFCASILNSTAFSKSNSHKKERFERVAVSFEEICSTQQGHITKGTVRGIYSFSIKAASGLYAEIESKEGEISSHWVGKSGNDYLTDKLASDHTETLLSLAYLNQMKIDFCLLDFTFPTVISGVRLHYDFE